MLHAAHPSRSRSVDDCPASNLEDCRSAFGIRRAHQKIESNLNESQGAPLSQDRTADDQTTDDQTKDDQTKDDQRTDDQDGRHHSSRGRRDRTWDDPSHHHGPLIQRRNVSECRARERLLHRPRTVRIRRSGADPRLRRHSPLVHGSNLPRLRSGGEVSDRNWTNVATT